jgi:hypothetical protein
MASVRLSVSLYDSGTQRRCSGAIWGLWRTLGYVVFQMVVAAMLVSAGVWGLVLLRRTR